MRTSHFLSLCASPALAFKHAFYLKALGDDVCSKQGKTVPGVVNEQTASWSEDSPCGPGEGPYKLPPANKANLRDYKSATAIGQLKGEIDGFCDKNHPLDMDSCCGALLDKWGALLQKSYDCIEVAEKDFAHWDCELGRCALMKSTGAKV